MKPLRTLGILIVTVGVLSGQVLVEDPVIKAQSARSPGDLPPVPRAVLEPPPLPPPETHLKDTRGYRASRNLRRTRRKVVKKKTKVPVRKAPIKKAPTKRP